jgi:hypothetical protein
MGNWFNSGESITHYCGGCDPKNKKSNKPKDTQTEQTFWFHPVTVEDHKLTCTACESTIQLGDEILIPMGD